MIESCEEIKRLEQRYEKILDDEIKRVEQRYEKIIDDTEKYYKDMLDKIRAEIEKKHARAKQMGSVLQMNAYTDCLQIIDKYKVESEEMNETNG